MATEKVLVDVWQTSEPMRVVLCPLGCDYSATVGDYWNRADSSQFTCEHDGIDEPCDIVERVYTSGKDAQGRTFSTSGWLTVVENATVGDLRKLSNGN